jgi:hypothetical protein
MRNGGANQEDWVTHRPLFRLASTIKNGRFNHENGLDMWLARGLGISSSARAARGDEEGDCGCADGYF